jgi:hypothetical protein
VRGCRHGAFCFDLTIFGSGWVSERNSGVIGGRQLDAKGRFVGLIGRRAQLAKARARGTTDRAVLAGAAGRLV